MRIFNRAHFPWAIFVAAATLFASWLYLGNFHPQRLPAGFRLPSSLVQRASEHHAGGTPLGLIFGSISLGIFIFAALLGVRKKLVLWRMGTVQRWLRAHIWLTLLTIPLVILHSGFRLGGPMTTLLIVLYIVVMVSGIYGLVLQHRIPRLMMERLPTETVYEQIPHVRAQLYEAALLLKLTMVAPNSPQRREVTNEIRNRYGSSPREFRVFKDRWKIPWGSWEEFHAGSQTRKTTRPGHPNTPLETAAMSATRADLGTPVGRAKAVVASAAQSPSVIAPAIDDGRAPQPESLETAGTPGRLPVPAPGGERAAGVASPAAPKTAVPLVAKPVEGVGLADADEASEAALLDFLNRDVLPYLGAKRGDRLRLGNERFSHDTFRFIKARVTEAYRARVDDLDGWCNERRMLDLQLKMQHWLHGWLFIHVPISFLLLILTVWHAIVTLVYY